MTVAELSARALVAYDELVTLAEDVEDEWTYVTDLAASWRVRIETVVSERGPEPVTAQVAAGVERAIEEIRLIRDPHRAVDWLSTFPQLVLLDLGERP